MLFNSLEFLYLFLPITYAVFWALTTKTHRYVWLTVTGYVFYAFWNYNFCALMAFSTVVNLPRFLGHPRSHESAVGVVHGQAQAAGVHEGV